MTPSGFVGSAAERLSCKRSASGKLSNLTLGTLLNAKFDIMPTRDLPIVKPDTAPTGEFPSVKCGIRLAGMLSNA
ncbi:unnamed protein product [Toxocara canis]|uniref:Transposase n=1 Tax=Toxocara canis TaxID=6265 RepID=A0A183VEB3_TOXCA|nr:unnamed protein product [Toxocara canis]